MDTLKTAALSLRRASFKPLNIEFALKPFVEDPTDLDDNVDAVVEHLRSGLEKTFGEFFKKLKPLRAEGTQSDLNGVEKDTSRSGGTIYYNWEITCPATITLGYKVKLNLARRWEEALQKADLLPGAKPPLTPKVILDVQEIAKDCGWDAAPDYFSEETEELVESWMFDRGHAEVEVHCSRTDSEGEEEDDVVEEPDVRFDHSLKSPNVKTVVQGDTVSVEVTAIDKLKIQNVYSPWDSKWHR